LADLEQLALSHEAPAKDLDSIRAFYRTQLSRIESQVANRAQRASIDNAIRDAINSARAGNYQQALRALRSCAQEHPGTFPLDGMREELEGRVARERASVLYHKAKASLAELVERPVLIQLLQVQRELAQARELDPKNRDVREALAEVAARISAAHSQLAAKPAPAGDRIETGIALGDPESPIDAILVEPTHVTPAPAACSPVAPVATAVSASQAAPTTGALQKGAAVRRSFAEEDVPNPTQRLIDAASNWSKVLKPFLVDNVLWFVGTFLVIAGFVVLIVTFWGSIEQNRILMHSLVYLALLTATGMFFALAYFMRSKYPQLESSSNVLLVIVTLLIPLVFAAAVLTTLVPSVSTDTIIQASMG
jgi:hypothetical protein